MIIRLLQQDVVVRHVTLWRACHVLCREDVCYQLPRTDRRMLQKYSFHQFPKEGNSRREWTKKMERLDPETNPRGEHKDSDNEWLQQLAMFYDRDTSERTADSFCPIQFLFFFSIKKLPRKRKKDVSDRWSSVEYNIIRSVSRVLLVLVNKQRFSLLLFDIPMCKHCMYTALKLLYCTHVKHMWNT